MHEQSVTSRTADLALMNLACLVVSALNYLRLCTTYRCCTEASLRAAGDAKVNDIVCHTCRDSSSASGYTSRQNAVGSAQEHSMMSEAYMTIGASTSLSLHVLPCPTIFNLDYKWVETTSLRQKWQRQNGHTTRYITSPWDYHPITVTMVAAVTATVMI